MSVIGKKSQSKRRAEKLADEVRARAKRVPMDTLAWIAGVSEKTVNEFRKGHTPRLATMQKLAEALEKIGKGLRPGDVSGSLILCSGSWGGRTTVSAITKGKRCGWCGDYHPDKLECDD
jgi:DNA-binding XRE family transcriptional regulator